MSQSLERQEGHHVIPLGLSRGPQLQWGQLQKHQRQLLLVDLLTETMVRVFKLLQGQWKLRRKRQQGKLNKASKVSLVGKLYEHVNQSFRAPQIHLVKVWRGNPLREDTGHPVLEKNKEPRHVSSSYRPVIFRNYCFGVLKLEAERPEMSSALSHPRY